MCQTRTFKYEKCGHFYARIVSTCGGTITKPTRAGGAKVKCDPTKSLRRKNLKYGLVLNYPGYCIYCAKQATKAVSQVKVASLMAQSEFSNDKKIERRARKAKQEHELECMVLDQVMKVTAPVAKRDIVLPKPQMNNRIVGGSPVKKAATLDMTEIGEAVQARVQNPARRTAPTDFKLSMRPRPHRNSRPGLLMKEGACYQNRRPAAVEKLGQHIACAS